MSLVDDYLGKLPDTKRIELERIRRIIQQSVLDAEEVISYGMPGFKYKGQYLAGYAAFKNHLSLFPTSEPVDKLKPQLAGYKTFRGTIQFTPEKPITETLIQELISIRLRVIEKK